MGEKGNVVREWIPRYARLSPVHWEFASDNRNLKFETYRVMVRKDGVRNPFEGQRTVGVTLGHLRIQWR
jgi:hypothetical protein